MPKTFADLVELMDRLRSPGGCPWDREQTYATLAPMLLEEAYEAFDALEEARLGRPADLREELGDLLFQITFFARVAQERGEFNIDDVIDEVHAKMVRRHPHVFGDTEAGDSAEGSCGTGKRLRLRKSVPRENFQARTADLFSTGSRPKRRR
jgi:MazG family protein